VYLQFEAEVPGLDTRLRPATIMSQGSGAWLAAILGAGYRELEGDRRW